MLNNIKFIRKNNFPQVPLSYQFIVGFKLKIPAKFVDYSFEVNKYQSSKCITFSHYKPISKIVLF